MAWILVPCLVSLRNEFNQLAPGRDKASDGSIGDPAHAGSSSDHNSDETGKTPTEDADNVNEVHAIDVDTDLRKPGWTLERAVQIVVARHRNGLDDRLQNVIYNRRIWSRSWGWTQRAYTGSNPHDKHAHFSARYTTAAENDTRPWGLLEADDMTKDEIKAAVRELLTDDADPVAAKLRARPWQYTGGGLQGATSTLDALSDSQGIAAAVAALRAELLAELASVQQPTITLTVEQVDRVGAIVAEATGSAIVDLRQRLQAAGLALAAKTL